MTFILVLPPVVPVDGAMREILIVLLILLLLAAHSRLEFHPHLADRAVLEDDRELLLGVESG
jgi:hypothetical protein